MSFLKNEAWAAPASCPISYDRVQEGMSWFVTKPTRFTTARKAASSAPCDTTGMEIAWNHGRYLVIDVSEAQLLRPNSFCRRSFSAQLWEVIHEIRFQSITIEFPIQMYWNPFSNAAYGSASVCICIGNPIVMDWDWISRITSQSCAENDRLQKLLCLRSWALESTLSSCPFTLP